MDERKKENPSQNINARGKYQKRCRLWKGLVNSSSFLSFSLFSECTAFYLFIEHTPAALT